MRMRVVLLATLLGAALQCAAASPPKRVELRFEIVTGSIKLGEGREVLEHDGTRYSVTSLSEPAGIAALFIDDVTRASRGRVTENGLRPESFSETGRKGGRREAKFDWSAMQLTLTRGKEKSVEELPPGTLDQASFPFSFAFEPPKAERFSTHVTDGKRLKEYEYRLVGRETLKTPMGKIETLHYEKVRDKDDKRGFDVWLSVEHHYLPVRLRYTEKDGRPFDSNIVDIRMQ